jgi:hypothetical protein
MIRTYKELSRLLTFEERFQYLKLNGAVGEETFGFDRFINQKFYKSQEWKIVRNTVILRDNGCDLGVDGYEIYERILIHHMNPISIKDIESNSDFLLNPEFLISTTHCTHNAITYGDKNLLSRTPIERKKNDTCPWRHT